MHSRRTTRHTPEPGIGELEPSVWESGPGAEPGLTLHDALTGVHLGTDGQGRPVTLPALGPHAVRIGVLGESLFGRLLASRLLAAGAQVTAVTRGPALWSALGEAAGGRLVLAEDTGRWPPRTPEPPGVGEGPQALVSDVRRPPPSPRGGGRWCTTVHVRRQVPKHGAFWHQLDAVLALGAGFADAVAPVCGTDAARTTARLAPGEIALFRGAATHVLRPDIAPGETALLTPPPQ